MVQVEAIRLNNHFLNVSHLINFLAILSKTGNRVIELLQWFQEREGWLTMGVLENARQLSAVFEGTWNSTCQTQDGQRVRKGTRKHKRAQTYNHSHHSSKTLLTCQVSLHLPEIETQLIVTKQSFYALVRAKNTYFDYATSYLLTKTNKQFVSKQSLNLV